MSGENPIIAGMAGRYATALFELALEDNKLEQVERDLSAFQAMLDTSDDLERLVRSPVFSADEQQRALTALLDKAGFSGLTANFLNLIARNRRLFAVRDMIKGFRTLLAHHRGEMTAEVTSAVALSDDQMATLKETLKSAVGQDVQIDTQVDAALLGGLVVKVGSRMIDNSIRTKLNNLKIAMKEVG